MRTSRPTRLVRIGTDVRDLRRAALECRHAIRRSATLTLTIPPCCSFLHPTSSGRREADRLRAAERHDPRTALAAATHPPVATPPERSKNNFMLRAARLRRAPGLVQSTIHNSNSRFHDQTATTPRIGDLLVGVDLPVVAS